MSDDWITLVPIETGFVPTVPDQNEALRVFSQFAPNAEDISIISHENIEFFDCGGNFEFIKCPKCGAIIDVDWWGSKMSQDYMPPKKNFLHRAARLLFRGNTKDLQNPSNGFRMQRYRLACCNHVSSFDTLIYQWPQAFGRFGLSGRNCNIGSLTEEQIAALSSALKCNVTVVYQHF